MQPLKGRPAVPHGAVADGNRVGYDLALFHAKFQGPALGTGVGARKWGGGWGAPADDLAAPPPRPRPNDTCRIVSSLGPVETRVAYVGPARSILLETLVWVRVELVAWRSLVAKVGV
jgi:hypothetical protein